MVQPINFHSLEDFLNAESDDISIVNLWFEKLSEYELDGSESLKEIEILLYAMRYLMNFSFTAAEELRGIAEREAAVTAEKEESWEEQKRELKEELASLRERITVKADAGESSEAFRAQIDSLKEENRQLQQLNRDRDREMADQRDRFEILVGRTDSLTRERDALIDHRAQLEDTIRELNRRLSAKNEDTTSEWETKKLKLRNEQAVTLSRKMQVVVAQNDQLRNEVSRLGDALEEATRLIEESSLKYAEVCKAFNESQAEVTSLYGENRVMREKLEESNRQMESVRSHIEDGDSALEIQIRDHLATIESLKKELYISKIEINELHDAMVSEKQDEKEAELEKIKQELVAATKTARSLFGELSSVSSSDPTSSLRLRMIQIENNLQQAKQETEYYKKMASEIEDNLILKEEQYSEITAEFDKLKEEKFGDCRKEISHLKSQIEFRNAQIVRLTNHCTLLQIELGKYTEISEIPTAIPTKLQRSDDSIVCARNIHSDLRNGEKLDVLMRENEDNISNKKGIEIQTQTNANKTHATMKISHTTTEEYGGWEQQAVLIAGLYSENMDLIEELAIKNQQLIEVEYTLKEAMKAIDGAKAPLKLAYEEIQRLKQNEDNLSHTESEENRVELLELRHFSTSVKNGGSELERKTEETTRKLIVERISFMRLSRVNAVLRAKSTRLEQVVRRMKERMTSSKVQFEKKCARLQYELDVTLLELANLQSQLLHSVPLNKYEQLIEKYKKVIISDIIEEEIEKESELRLGTIPSINESDDKDMEAKNDYLKKIVNILSEQNDFWKNETEILRTENDELKKFMEDMENESDLKIVLATIEHRLLDTIREQQERTREHMVIQRKRREVEESFANQRIKWMSERRKLLRIIHSFHTTALRLLSNNVNIVPLEQLELLRLKIKETQDNKKQTAKMKQQAEELRDQLDTQIMKIKSAEEARKTMELHGIDELKIEKNLQAAYFSVASQNARAERLRNMLNLRERELMVVREEMEQLKEANESNITLILNSNLWKRNDESEEENINSKKMKEYVNMEERRVVRKEYEYESDIESEESSEVSSLQERVVMNTLVHESVKTFEAKVVQMREMAQLCIQSYKDQLKLKESAVDSYKELLMKRIKEPTVKMKEVEIVREVKIKDDQAEQKLRQAVSEIVRLKEEIDELETANRNLFSERKTVLPIVDSVAIQTNEDQLKGEQIDSDMKNEPLISTGILKTENTVAQDGEQLRLHNNVRAMRLQIRRLTASNKELQTTCEKIRQEAKDKLNAKSEKSVDHTILLMRTEVERLRKEHRFMRGKAEEQKYIITKLNVQLTESKRNNKEEVSKWHKQKKAEEVIKMLRTKLKDATNKEKDLKEKLEKREKRLDKSLRNEESRQKEIERMNKRLQDLKEQRESAENESRQLLTLRDRMQGELDRRETEVASLMAKLRRLERSNAELQLQVASNKEQPLMHNNNIRTETTKQSEQVEFQLKEELKTVELRYQACRDRLVKLEKNYGMLVEEHSKVIRKLGVKEGHSTGAVAVLSDKLQAKDKEIAHLKMTISNLERRLSSDTT